jgi:hypothetical protein
LDGNLRIMQGLVTAKGKRRMMMTLTMKMVTVMGYAYYMEWSNKEGK